MNIIQLGQLLGDVIGSYMGLDPSRVVLVDEGFDGPKDKNLYVLVIHDPLGAETASQEIRGQIMVNGYFE